MAIQPRFGNLPTVVTDALDAARRHDVDAFLACFTTGASVEAWGLAHTTSASVEKWARQLLSTEPLTLTDFIHAQLGEITAVHAQMASRGYTGPVTFAFTLAGTRIRALHMTT
ncbi:MAG: hypothetical protein ABWX92_04715 [Mycetocola sp.]